ncbi:MAG: carboxypeptidase-like regulatory domain-containing protein, partial [Muribaculaceae bacterium]|nr:carboxypeptidase-like regulatory domain-containing protein [Muribaculaceae bacterium]
MLIVAAVEAAGDMACPVVVDSVTRLPLPSATIFDNRGTVIGITDTHGRAGRVPASSYPITVRYLGFKETAVATPADTIFMAENPMELNEVTVQSRQQKVLHVLAYVREYSTLTSYTDTVFLFREKMVDYMLNSNPKVKFNDWRVPRILKSRSYYRFTNLAGLDSVSDNCSNHFSWADWIGIAPAPEMPARLHGHEFATDTLYGRYSP